MKPAVAILLAALLLTGCKTVAPAPDRPRPMVQVEEQPRWYAVASAEDVQRLQRIDDAWRQALAETRAKGFVKAVEDEGELLKPGAALPRPAPPPGPYRCRTIKLGTLNG